MNITTKLIWVGHRHDTFVDVQFSPFKLLRKYYSMNFIEMAEAKQSTFKFMLKPKPLFTQPTLTSHTIGRTSYLYTYLLSQVWTLVCKAICYIMFCTTFTCCKLLFGNLLFQEILSQHQNKIKLEKALLSTCKFGSFSRLNVECSTFILDVGWTTRCWMDDSMLDEYYVAASAFSCCSALFS